jgi:hypothetical protein
MAAAAVARDPAAAALASELSYSLAAIMQEVRSRRPAAAAAALHRDLVMLARAEGPLPGQSSHHPAAGAGSTAASAAHKAAAAAAASEAVPSVEASCCHVPRRRSNMELQELGLLQVQVTQHDGSGQAKQQRSPRGLPAPVPAAGPRYLVSTPQLDWQPSAGVAQQGANGGGLLPQQLQPVWAIHCQPEPQAGAAAACTQQRAILPSPQPAQRQQQQKPCPGAKPPELTVTEGACKPAGLPSWPAAAQLQ